MTPPFEGIDSPTVQILGLVYPEGREGEGRERVGGMEGDGMGRGMGMGWKGDGKGRNGTGVDTVNR